MTPPPPDLQLALRGPAGARARRLRAPLVAALLAALFSLADSPGAAGPENPGDPIRPGREIYRDACASCHGPDGRGAPRTHVVFETPLPDFTDCSFATREPDTDWFAIVHDGGPVRAFSEEMPAFGELLGAGEIEAAIAWTRTLCADAAWPRGELNLPRPLVTEKAFPEDEALLTVEVSTEQEDEVSAEILWEQRFGARSQWEVAVPFVWIESADPANPSGESERASGVGDVAAAVKRAFYHNLERGSIFSLTAEVILPTGDEDRDLGKGTAVLEPFATWGQILPAEMFLQAQAGFELPLDSDKAEDEAFLRFAWGGTATTGRFGREWSPMIEVLGATEMAAGAEREWDILPQMQVTLSTRQHVRINIGVRAPVTQRDERATSVVAYLLWDWFDGGLFEGW